MCARLSRAKHHILTCEIERINLKMNGKMHLIRKIIDGKMSIKEIDSSCSNYIPGELLYYVDPKSYMTSTSHISNSLFVNKRFNCCRSLFESLSTANYSLVKGAVLSERLYDNPSIRKSEDMDILIEPNAIDEVKSILHKFGFQQGKIINGEVVPYTRESLIFQKAFTHQIASFVKLTHDTFPVSINIDINTSVMWGETKKPIDISIFLNNTEYINLYGIQVKRLTKEYEFIALCLHHYKDLNSLFMLWNSGIKLSLFLDIFFYINNVDLDMNKIKEICEALGVSEYIYFCLFHTWNVLGGKSLEQYVKFFEIESYKYILNRIGLSDDEYKYLPKGISQYLFDESFKNDLYPLLTTQDLHNIKMNKLHM